MTPAVPVVLLLLAGLAAERQEKIALAYASSHGLRLVALAPDEASALASVTVGRATTVLVVALPHAGMAVLDAAGVPVVCARPPTRVGVRLDERAELIRAALRNSAGNAPLVAQLLGLPLAEVAALAGEVPRPRGPMDGSRPTLRRSHL